MYRCSCFGQERIQDVLLYVQRRAVPDQGKITHTRLHEPVVCAHLPLLPLHPHSTYVPQVTFRNEASGEYMFYLVTFDATSPGVLSTIKLVTAVRRVASASVGVENPLSTPVCFTTECRSPDISAPPQTTVPGQSKVCMFRLYLLGWVVIDFM